MSTYKADIVIFGAGIAGLWLHALLKTRGYNSLLLETHCIGGVQTIGSQGILHSGLKYAFAGKVNKLAKSISAMPDRWRKCLSGDGELDLTAVQVQAETQQLMIPSGFMGGLIKLVTQKTLGGSVRAIPKEEWSDDVRKTGFKGQLIYMDEPVLNIPSLITALASPYRDSIKKINWNDISFDKNAVKIGDKTIHADHIIFTAAQSNHGIARQLGHDHGLKTQKRPLLMGMMRPAPFPLFAHLVGKSDKPVATITSHSDKNGDLVWYLGAQVAERPKEDNPDLVFNAAKAAFSKYLPKLDLGGVEWNTWGVDRIEGHSDTDGWMPDTPVVHSYENFHYCWPTKLTFAPLLSDAIFSKLDLDHGDNKSSDWSFLENAPIGEPVWDSSDDWT